MKPIKQKEEIREICQFVAAWFGVPEELLMAGNKAKHIIHMRKIAIYLVRDISGAKVEHIGRYFGYADHTSVLGMLRGAESLMREDESFAAEVNTIKEKWYD